MLVLHGAAVFAGGIGALLPVIPPGKGDACVEPVDIMRRDHMKFLLHQRDDTVHRGIRGSRHSLTGCIGCHVQKDAQGMPIPVNAKDQFCQSCHGFAGVRMDCFECHAAVPAETGARAGGRAAMRSPPLAADGSVTAGVH